MRGTGETGVVVAEGEDWGDGVPTAGKAGEKEGRGEAVMAGEDDGVPGVAVEAGAGLVGVLGDAAGGPPAEGELVFWTAGEATLGLGLDLGLDCTGTAGLPAETGPAGTPGHLQFVWSEGMQHIAQGITVVLR